MDNQNNAAVILIPQNNEDMIHMATNNVSYIKIFSVLKTLEKFLATEIAQEARAVVGNDPIAMERYIDEKIREQNNSGNIKLN